VRACVLGQVVPSAKDGLHCGHTRRHRLPSQLSSSRPPRTGSIAAWLTSLPLLRIERVVPSAKDGLHCGATTPESASMITARRPVRQGRAPLRRCGRTSGTRCAGCRPVRQGRAPLRPRS